jgi:hypothetical protein
MILGDAQANAGGQVGQIHGGLDLFLFDTADDDTPIPSHQNKPTQLLIILSALLRHLLIYDNPNQDIECFLAPDPFK